MNVAVFLIICHTIHQFTIGTDHCLLVDGDVLHNIAYARHGFSAQGSCQCRELEAGMNMEVHIEDGERLDGIELFHFEHFVGVVIIGLGRRCVAGCFEKRFADIARHTIDQQV